MCMNSPDLWPAHMIYQRGIHNIFLQLPVQLQVSTQRLVNYHMLSMDVLQYMC